jgi:ribonuclease HI
LIATPKQENYSLFTDGSSIQNPGHAGAGAVLLDPFGTVIFSVGIYLGVATNNVAEYEGLILGAQQSLAYGLLKVSIFADSLLVVNQLKGLWRVKAPALKDYYQRARAILAKFDSWSIGHVYRRFNALADKMANSAAQLGKGGSLSQGTLLTNEDFL